VQQYVKKVAFGTLALWLAASAASCGRSENVGWSNREAPDSADPSANAVDGAWGQPEPALEVDQEEYARLAESLSEVQMAVMADSQVMAYWSDLVTEVDQMVLANSVFHRGLIERLAEIEALVDASEQPGGESLSAEQLAELGRHHRNIQREMARARSQVFKTPEYSPRYLAFQAELYDRMRQLDPTKIEDINKLEKLERQYFLDPETSSPVPGMAPQR
jgi:hypothetical protein